MWLKLLTVNIVLKIVLTIWRNQEKNELNNEYLDLEILCALE